MFSFVNFLQKSSVIGSSALQKDLLAGSADIKTKTDVRLSLSGGSGRGMRAIEEKEGEVLCVEGSECKVE